MNYSEIHRQTLTHTIKNALFQIVGQEKEMLAIYLFGSLVNGDFKTSSDIDLAFVTDRSLYTDSPLMAFSRAREISADISLIVQRPVDVYLLNEASLFFAFDVITNGTCIYEKDQVKRSLYETCLRGRYYDVKPLFKNLRHQHMITV